MDNDTYDVIIVGAGLSGITCAQTILNKSNHINLKIISPEIGGQLQFSGDINYGPYFIRDDYLHVTKFFTKKDEITRNDFVFHHGKKSYQTGFNIRTLRHIPTHVSFRLILRKFHQEFEKFRINCSTMPQSLALESNSFLFSLYNKNALDWIIENELYEYYNDFLLYILQSIAFSTADKMNAFHLLAILTSVHIGSYRYHFDKKLFKDIEKHYLRDSVKLIEKIENEYIIYTQNNFNFRTKQVVLATPTSISSQLCHFTHNKSVNSFMFHIKGDIKKKFKTRRTNLFNPSDEITVIDKISNKENEYLLYAKIPNPSISNVFDNFTILCEKKWENCFYWEGSHIVQFEQDKHFFVIGSHNVPLLEDVFIYATYAGNLVVKNFDNNRGLI